MKDPYISRLKRPGAAMALAFLLPTLLACTEDDGAQAQEARPIRISEMGFNQGSSDAPVKILEFSDFGCGYCRVFHSETYPTLKEIYVDGGFVEWKHVPFVLGRFPNGLEAALAAECAGEQDGFFNLHGRLFRDQQGWRSSDDPNALFTRMAEEEGLDAARLETCIEG